MNEELQKALAESVRLATEGLKQGKDFVVAQAPDVIQQLLRWKYWEAAIWLGIGCCCLIAAYVMLRAAVNFLKEYDIDSAGLCGVVAAVCGLAGVVNIVQNMLVMVQITVAPKIYLIEWAMAQVKK